MHRPAAARFKYRRGSRCQRWCRFLIPLAAPSGTISAHESLLLRGLDSLSPSAPARASPSDLAARLLFCFSLGIVVCCARSEQGGLSSAAESGGTLGSFQYGWDRRCFLMASRPRPRARSQLRKPVPPAPARTHARTLPHSPRRRIAARPGACSAPSKA